MHKTFDLCTAHAHYRDIWQFLNPAHIRLLHVLYYVIDLNHKHHLGWEEYVHAYGVLDQAWNRVNADTEACFVESLPL